MYIVYQNVWKWLRTFYDPYWYTYMYLKYTIEYIVYEYQMYQHNCRHSIIYIEVYMNC